MTGVTAVIFDAGEYEYPCKLWYSIMESVSSYCTIKQWREKRNIYFPNNSTKFDIRDKKCLSAIHTSLNLAAGLLKTVIVLYENGIIHGDLNPGNILWILENEAIDKELERLASYSYAVLGELEPFRVKLIDMGASKANDIENAGLIRDSWKLYEHMKSFLFPIFVDQKLKFAEEPRELFKASFLSNASSMILVHNHPSGVLRPSPDDTRMTDRLLQVAGLMGVQLLDHIIVGGNNQEYFSFRSQKLISYQSIKYTSDYHALSFDEVGLVAEEGWER